MKPYCNFPWRAVQEGVVGDRHGCVLDHGHDGDHKCDSSCGATYPQDSLPCPNCHGTGRVARSVSENKDRQR